MLVRHKVALVAAVSLLGAGIYGLRAPKPSRVVFLAVGQGDCSVIQSQGKTVMIDTGPERAGEWIVVPTLRRLGVDKLDLVLLTHPDADHIAALPSIARKIKIVKVVAPAYFRDHPDLVRTLKDSGIGSDRVAWVGGPSDAKVGKFLLHLDVPPWQSGDPDNDGSLMARVSGPNLSITFTGDAGFMEEIAMMRKGSWSADVLKLGHHGSRYSSGDSWLEHVHPKIAVVSCGRDNAYGHPAQEVLDRCAARGIRVRRTDTEGHLTFNLP